MKNQNHYKTDYDFLKPLIDRPDLEPDPAFIMSLKKKIDKSNNEKKFRFPRNLIFVGVSLLAIFTVSLLMLTLNFGGLSSSTRLTEPTSLSDTSVSNYTIEELISNHSYYNHMYQKLLEAKMPDDYAAEVFIKYLEALRNDDTEEYARYSDTGVDEKTEALMNEYKEMDYSSFFIESIIPNEGESIYRVKLNFDQLDGSLGTNIIYIQMLDSKVSINDSLENFLTTDATKKVPEQAVSIMDTVEFDTLCFNGRLIVDMYLNVEFVNGCTTDKDKIQSVMSILDNLPIKKPSQEENGERMTAIQQTDNYLIYLGNSVSFDDREYTITIYEDGIFQYLPKGMEGLGDITIKSYTEKYNEVKRLLDEMAE